ncbi:MAG: MgtC/SapB family protein [Clostridia bacterium]|nr:MgtC/SapB family protein [Clostridia bacterium]
MTDIWNNFVDIFNQYIIDFSWVSVILRIILAVLVGGIIGSERGRSGSPAGLRTHILVCVGSAMTALISVFIAKNGDFGDIARIPAQVISGIGFLGAGMIIVKKNNVITGLTTAAGMWATATIGIALGYGFYLGALIATAACIFTAAFLTRLERRTNKSIHVYAEISEAEKSGAITEEIRALLGKEALIEVSRPRSGTSGNVGLYITVSTQNAAPNCREHIEKIDGIFFAILE